MRWLIVGHQPPSIDPSAPLGLAAVRRALLAGDDVLTVSPEPSSADRAVGLGGLAGIARLRRMASLADGLHLCLGVAVGPTPSATARRSVAERAALRGLFGAFDRVVVDITSDDLHRMPGGRAGALVLRSGARFVVDDDAAATVLVQRGAPAHLVEVRQPVEPTAFRADHLAWRSPHRMGTALGEALPGADPHAIENWLRHVTHRGVERRPPERTVADVLRSVAPLELPAPPRSGARRILGRVALRATRWLIEPVVAHVNRLHAAAIVAAEAATHDRPGDGDDGTDAVSSR